VHENAVKAARAAGINVVSLANNHTTDFGKEALAETFSTLKNAGINPVGNGADYCTEVNASKVCFLAWNDTFAPLDLKTISEETAKRKTSDTFLVASVHFGNEYSATGTARQKLVAKTLIDSGADVVIGHHPHVVENMEMYKGKPIFYSLGNFIFDQYFSEETQIGLAVRAEIRDDTVLYELIPIDLHKSRPTRMPPSEAREFLAEKELHETFIIPR
jgi:poly-gamma-glutamate synthesis protein (capsule biosynthesis protein)